MDSPSLAARDTATNVLINPDEPLAPPEDRSEDSDRQQSHMRAVLLSISALFRNLANASGSLPVDLEPGNLIPMFTLPTPRPQLTNDLPRGMHTASQVKCSSRESLVNGTNEQLLGEDSLVSPPEIAANKTLQLQECAAVPSEEASVQSNDGKEEDEEEELMKEFCEKYDQAETIFLWERYFFEHQDGEWEDGEPDDDPANWPEMEIRSSFPEEDPDVWILPPKSRYEIYLDLFVATKAPDDDVFPEPVFRDIVLGKVNILKKLQAFILQTYKIESETSEDRKAKRPGRADQGQRPQYDAASVDSDVERKLPNIQYFVDDIVTLIHGLTKAVHDEATSDDISQALEAFDAERQELWSWRWRGIADWDGEHRWPAYSCALRDALFGLWPTKGKDEYHTGEWDDCIHETLDTTNADPDYEPYDLHEHDLRILDAAYIESHGPFRFIPTHSIDDHLRITQRRYINIYVDWRTLGGIRHHTVLAKRKGNRTVFDILMKCKHSTLSKRPFLISLHHHMQISIMLFFFQDETKPGWTPRQPRSLLEAFYTRFTNRRTSLTILRSLEKDLSITSTPEEMNERGEVYVKTIKSWALMVRRDSEYRCLFAFRQRMDDLVKTLQEWKPTTFWELRYSGYGGVDSVGLWGYYVALMVGGLTLLITVAAAILQTYAGFRSLNPSP